MRPHAAALVPAIVVGSALLARLLCHPRARRFLLDRPNARSSHRVPTPRGGGLAIVVFTLAAVVAPTAWGEVPGGALRAWAAGALAIAAVGLIDDLREVPRSLRFGVQLATAVAATLAVGAWQMVDLGPLGVVSLGAAGLPVTVLWIVGLTNAWNFMDGVDGMAGLAAVVAAVCAVVVAAAAAPVAALGIPLAAATLGFLALNWPPARIFMGDVGSTFLGFSLALLPLLGDARGGGALWLAVLPVWPFVFDTTLTLLRRAWRRENVFTAHRSHLYQRLVIAGWSHARVSVLYGLLTLGGGLSALALRQGAPRPAVLAAVALGSAAVLLLTRAAERGAAPSAT